MCVSYEINDYIKLKNEIVDSIPKEYHGKIVKIKKKRKPNSYGIEPILNEEAGNEGLWWIGQYSILRKANSKEIKEYKDMG